MKKIAIFNVGGASSAYIEVDDTRVVVDLGGGNDFSPVDDFLIPLAERRDYKKDPMSNDRYWINQLFLTHLDNDHISDFPRFDENFIPELFTVPNDHQSIHENLRIDRDKVPDNDTVKSILANMRKRIPGKKSTQPDFQRPLAVHNEDIFSLYYIPPKECELLDDSTDSEYNFYGNNISLVVHLKINGYTILFPGDMMDNGMEYLINKNKYFKTKLITEGIDFLIAPHHGLDTSFPNSLFKTIKDNKVRLTIISEKELEKDDAENRHDVDKRYYQPEFSKGFDISNGAKDTQYAIITSKHITGHILIDFDSQTPIVKRCTTEELLDAFES